MWGVRGVGYSPTWEFVLVAVVMIVVTAVRLVRRDFGLGFWFGFIVQLGALAALAT